MHTTRLRRALALITTAAVVASLAVASAAAPASAAKPKCFGKTATIVGTKKADVIIGTRKRDVIVAKGGADKIFGRGGNDLICAGAGNDKVAGNAGVDKLIAGAGADKLFGGTGPDRLFGGPGPDVIAGQPGNDVIDGGLGVDTCFQGIGSGPVVRCELPAAPVAPPTPKTLAVAYSDVVRDQQFGTGDVLIAKLVDTNLDGTPSPGDTIVMDRYPEDTDAATFGKWDVTSHVVTSVDKARSDHLLVKAESGWHGWWTAVNGIEQYREAVELSDISPSSAGALSYIQDAIVNPSDRDYLRIQDGSPSVRVTDFTQGKPTFDGTDDPFIDVDLYYSP